MGGCGASAGRLCTRAANWAVLGGRSTWTLECSRRLSMRRRHDPLLWFALIWACFALIVEVATLVTGHEFMAFGRLSGAAAEHVRITVISLAVVLGLGVYLRRARSAL